MYSLFLIFVFLFTKSICSDEDRPVSEILTSSKLIENKKFHLTCHASGKLPITFEWFFNGQKIAPNDNIAITNLDESSMLNIRSMSVDQSGEYVCKTKNSFGQDNRSVQIKLNGK